MKSWFSWIKPTVQTWSTEWPFQILDSMPQQISKAKSKPAGPNLPKTSDVDYSATTTLFRERLVPMERSRQELSNSTNIALFRCTKQRETPSILRCENCLYRNVETLHLPRLLWYHLLGERADPHTRHSHTQRDRQEIYVVHLDEATSTGKLRALLRVQAPLLFSPQAPRRIRSVPTGDFSKSRLYTSGSSNRGYILTVVSRPLVSPRLRVT